MQVVNRDDAWNFEHCLFKFPEIDFGRDTFKSDQVRGMMKRPIPAPKMGSANVVQPAYMMIKAAAITTRRLWMFVGTQARRRERKAVPSPRDQGRAVKTEARTVEALNGGERQEPPDPGAR